jgi:hypothetical protein
LLTRFDNAAPSAASASTRPMVETRKLAHEIVEAAQARAGARAS